MGCTCWGTSRRWRASTAWCVFLPPWLCVCLCVVFVCVYMPGDQPTVACESCVVGISTTLALCVYVLYLYVFICQGTSRRWRVRAAWCIFLPPWLCVLFLCCICMCLYARGPACRGVCEQCVVRIFTSLALCVYVCVCVRVCVCVYVLKDQPAMACKHCVVRTLPPCCL